jgi:hypothetical protein
MTSANQLIEFGYLLNQVFDPGLADFRQIQEAQSPLGAAVFSVLTSRSVFWATQSLAFGYALDLQDGAFDDVSREEYTELFSTDKFVGYVDESGLDPRDATLLGAARVLDSLLNVEMRQAAMSVNVAVNQCIQGCAAGDDDCVRRCIMRWG